MSITIRHSSALPPPRPSARHCGDHPHPRASDRSPAERDSHREALQRGWQSGMRRESRARCTTWENAPGRRAPGRPERSRGQAKRRRGVPPANCPFCWERGKTTAPTFARSAITNQCERKPRGLAYRQVIAGDHPQKGRSLGTSAHQNRTKDRYTIVTPEAVPGIPFFTQKVTQYQHNRRNCIPATRGDAWLLWRALSKDAEFI